MTKRSTTLSLVATALALGAGSNALHAQTGTDGQADITLEEAIAIAVAETGGTVLEAEWETKNSIRIVEVEVATDSGEVELTIDPITGTVLSTEVDEGDNDGEEGDDDD